MNKSEVEHLARFFEKARTASGGAGTGTGCGNLVSFIIVSCLRPAIFDESKQALTA